LAAHSKTTGRTEAGRKHGRGPCLRTMAPRQDHAAVAEAFLDTARQFVNQRLDEYLPSPRTIPTALHKAMRYSVFAGGKRLRPALVLASAEAVGGAYEDAAPAACAVEMIHTYSLIHDDLPAMDDDDLRRGRPTCHKAFGEALAILAGDALLTRAFEMLTRTRRAAAVPGILRALAQGAGTHGMVGGQVLDIEGEGKRATLASVLAIHRWKTAALIAACCEAGALSAGASQAEHEKLGEYGRKIGLAFQVVDDILDITSSAEALGKTPGKDARAGKATYPAVLGLEKAKREAERFLNQALAALHDLGPRARTLEALGYFVVERLS
jgi:geranylgeranyl diphosphate synthase type II